MMKQEILVVEMASKPKVPKPYNPNKPKKPSSKWESNGYSFTTNKGVTRKRKIK